MAPSSPLRFCKNAQPLQLKLPENSLLLLSESFGPSVITEEKRPSFFGLAVKGPIQPKRQMGRNTMLHLRSRLPFLASPKPSELSSWFSPLSPDNMVTLQEPTDAQSVSPNGKCHEDMCFSGRHSPFCNTNLSTTISSTFSPPSMSLLPSSHARGWCHLAIPPPGAPDALLPAFLVC